MQGGGVAAVNAGRWKEDSQQEKDGRQVDCGQTGSRSIGGRQIGRGQTNFYSTKRRQANFLQVHRQASNRFKLRLHTVEK
jgi:hypothetical protein